MVFVFKEAMKAAFPVQMGRISPVFDSCTRLLLVEEGEGREAGREEVSLEGVPRLARASRLKELGVDVLVCGGISPWVASQVEALGIGLLPWVAGPVDMVVEAFFGGRLPDPALTLPGCGGMCRRRGRGRRRGGGRRGPGGFPGPHGWA